MNHITKALKLRHTCFNTEPSKNCQKEIKLFFVATCYTFSRSIIKFEQLLNLKKYLFLPRPVCLGLAVGVFHIKADIEGKFRRYMVT